MKSILVKLLLAGIAPFAVLGILLFAGTNANAQTTAPNPVYVPVPVNNGGLFGNSYGGLGQLFIYDQLFNRSGTLPGVRANNLGDLFVLSQLFNGGYGYNNGLFGNGGNGGYNNLGDLFVLDRLFGTTAGHSSIFSGKSGNLGDFMILNQLFR